MKKLNTRLDEAMSVTLRKSKSQPGSFKVHSVGSKMKSHGGMKPGERVKDHEIDYLHDSGIKVKYHKEDVEEAIERKADHKLIMVTDPNTGKTVLRKAPRKEIEIGKGKNESVEVTEDYSAMKDAQAHAKKDGANYDRDVSVQHKYDAYHMKKRGYTHRKYNSYGSYEYNKHGDGNKITSADHHGISEQNTNVRELGKTKAVWKIGKPKPIAGHPDYVSASDINNANLKNKRKKVNELSDKTKVNYINKANKEITDKEKLHLKIGAQGDKDKNLEKRRKGVALAKSKLGEASAADVLKKRYASYDPDDNPQATKRVKDHLPGMKTYKLHPDAKLTHRGYSKKGKMAALKKQHARRPEQYGITKEGWFCSKETVNELKLNTMKSYRKKAQADIQTGENARHKGYPEKDIDKRQDKRYKGIDTANKRIAKKQVKMAKGVAFDKRYKGGNMTGASKAIDKIKPGLSDHPKVKAALRRANEEFNTGE